MNDNTASKKDFYKAGAYASLLAALSVPLSFQASVTAIKLSRSLSGVEAIFLASAPLSQWFILPDGA